MKIILLRALAIIAILSIVLLPIYWLVSTSLKSNKEITQDGTLYPHVASFDNYFHLFSEKEFGAYLTNSLVVTAISVLIALVMGSLGAYAIARFKLPYGLERKIGLSLLTLRIVPPVVILIPVYLLMLQLKLLDTWLGLIMTYTAFNITFCVWMMESFFREIPVDLEEAAWLMAIRASRLSGALPCHWPHLDWRRQRFSPSSSPSMSFCLP